MRPLCVAAWLSVALLVAPGVLATHDADATMGRDAAWPTLAWQRSVPESFPVFGSLVAVNDTLYATERDGRLFAFNATTGEPVFVIRVGPRLDRAGSVATEDGRLTLGTADGHVAAYDPVNGTQLWRVRIGEAHTSSVFVVNGTAVVGDEDGRVLALHAATGTVLWATETGLTSHSTPIVRGGDVYFTAYEAFAPLPGESNAPPSLGYLLKLNATSGDEAWRVPLGEGVPVTPRVEDNAVFVTLSLGQVDARAAADGALLWSHRPASGALSGAARAGDHLLVTADDGHVVALDAATGDVIWERAYPGLLSAPRVVGDVAFFGSSRFAGLLALDVADGSVLWKDVWPRAPRSLRDVVVGTPRVHNDVAFVGATDGFVRAFTVNDTESATAARRVTVSDLVLRPANVTVDPLTRAVREPVTATVTVTNAGTVAATAAVHVLVNGRAFAREDVAVDAGASVPVTFTPFQVREGVNAIEVGATANVVTIVHRLDVAEAASTPFEPARPWWASSTVAALVLGSAAALLYFLWPKRRA